MDEFLKFGRDGFDVLQPYPLVQAAMIIVIFLPGGLMEGFSRLYNWVRSLGKPKEKPTEPTTA